VGADTDLGFLRNVPGVQQLTTPTENQPLWIMDLSEGVDGRAVLAACFERGVPLTHFDIAPPTLHDIFVSLVEEAA
jgi:ABC-2 type transport system ATP-binding protein